MWEEIFKVSDVQFLVNRLLFTIPFLIFTVFWAYGTRKESIIFRGMGILGVAVGVYLNVATAYFYFQDTAQLNSGKYLVLEGEATNIDVDKKESSFMVNKEIFRGGDYWLWIVPDSNVMRKISNYPKVRVIYIPGAEHGKGAPGNKVLRIDVLT